MLNKERSDEEIIGAFKGGTVPVYSGDIIIRHHRVAVCGLAPVDHYYITQFQPRLNIFYPYLFILDLFILDPQIVASVSGRKDVGSVRFCRVETLFLGDLESPDQELPTLTPGESWMAHLVRVDTLKDGTRVINLPKRQHLTYGDGDLLDRFFVETNSEISVRPQPTTQVKPLGILDGLISA